MPLIPVLEQKTIDDLLLIYDLSGTFVFAISGAMLGARRGLDVFGIMVLSFVASSAGGITRDLLVARTPVVLRSDLYALAALAGAGIIVVGHGLNWPVVPTAIGGAVVCFGLRLLAIRYGWNLPGAPPIDSGDEADKRQ